MSEFSVPVTSIASIKDHPDADRLSIVTMEGMDYEVICGRDQYKVGDRVIYIPEAAILPDEMIEAMGLTGKLAGKDKNRVKAARLRGVLSQGLVCGCKEYFQKDDGSVVEATPGLDAAPYLGITKYVPVVPVDMGWQVEPAVGRTVKFDIENLKKYPDVMRDDDTVVITEKLHGTFLHCGYDQDEGFIIASKGLAEKGLQFKMIEENLEKNLYVNQCYRKSALCDRLKTMVEQEDLKAAYALGEIVGPGVQDLHYGLDEKTIFLFDLYIIKGGRGYYLDYEDFMEMSSWLVDGKAIRHVPLVMKNAPWHPAVIKQYISAKERVSGEERHTQEGFVIKPMVERRDEQIGRVILKAISEDYLTRRGGTEHN